MGLELKVLHFYFLPTSTDQSWHSRLLTNYTVIPHHNNHLLVVCLIHTGSKRWWGSTSWGSSAASPRSPMLHGDTSCRSIWAPWKNQQILAQNSHVILHRVHPQVRSWISHRLQGNQLGGQLMLHPAVDLAWAAWKTNKSFFKIPSLWWHHNADSYGAVQEGGGRQRAGLARMFVSRNSLRRADHLALVV